MAELLELDCVVCDVVFKAKRSHARYCSEACRSRLRRSRKPVTKAVKKAVAQAAAMAVTEDSDVVVPPARWIVAPEEGRAAGKPIRPLSDEQYQARLVRHLAGCIDGHEWQKWPAGLVSCRRCTSQLVKAP